MKYYKKTLDEKESIININYSEGIVEVYSTRNATLKKLNKYLGKPYKEDLVNGIIYSCEWHIPFNERNKIRKIFAMGTYMTYQQK